MNRTSTLKRSAFKRPEPLKVANPAHSAVKPIRPRRCNQHKGGCGEQFSPLRPMQTACSPKCAQAMAAVARAKIEAREAADDKRQTRAQLEALKTLPQLKKEAQQAFNAFIRARDRAAGYACICCNQPLDWSTSGITGSRVDAGHYRSTGSADHLRFNEANCHAQRVHCNRHGAGRAVDYRLGLIQRIGQPAVEALECNNDSRKWSREEVRGIRDMYRRRAREFVTTQYKATKD